MGDTPEGERWRTATQPFQAGAQAQGPPRLPQRWRLTRFLGRGGQAEVWLAHDTRLGESVAVKVFRPELSHESLERLRREVRLGRSLQHPRLVRVFELIEEVDGGRLAMAMEWLPGGSLAQRLPSAPLSPPEVIEIAEQTLEALAYLHDSNIIHRDVKPSNLLVDASGTIRLGDLGLVRMPSEGGPLTRTGVAVGTPAYMSPEQLRSDRLTGASDLYSLGASLFHLLTGREVFSGNSDFDVANQHLEMKPVNPRTLNKNCPRWFAAFLLRLLEKDPADRWPDGGTALEALRSRRGLTSPRKRRWFAAGAGVILALAALTAAGVSSYLRSPRQSSATVQLEGERVRGLDSDGRELWRYDAATPIRQMERGDFTGDGELDVAISAMADVDQFGRRDLPYSPTEILVVSSRGKLLSRYFPEAAVQRDWGTFEPPTLRPRLTAFDLDGDGIHELLLNMRHRVLGSSYLFVYWPRFDLWEPVLSSGGYIVRVDPVPHPERPRLRVVAYNSRLAALHFAMEIEMTVPGTSRRRTSDTPARYVDGAVPLGVSQLRWMTPIGSFQPGHIGEHADDGSLPGDGWTVVTPSGPWRVDAWGNPVPGSNEGRDLGARRIQLLHDLRFLNRRAVQASGPALVEALENNRREFADLLNEPYYPEILVLYEARVLAAVGRPLDGADLLQDQWVRSGNESLGLHRAQFLAIGGRLEEAARALQRNIDRSVTPSGDFLSLRLLSYVAAEMGDEVRVSGAVNTLAASFTKYASLTPEVRARLWWDRARVEDADLPPTDFFPDGSALACLVRWRLGLTGPDDVESMDAFAAVNRDAEPEALVAAAAAELGLNRPMAALTRLESLLPGLVWEARQEFRIQQYLHLAQALHVRALVDVGRREEAEAVAERVGQELRPGLLPAIILEEVLRSDR